MNKKGAEMTIGTIIAITLGVALLVFLIFGFSQGWGNLMDTINPISGGDANVDDIVRGCDVACAGNNNYAYCTQVRTVKFGKGAEPETETGSCAELGANEELGLNIYCDMEC